MLRTPKLADHFKIDMARPDWLMIFAVGSHVMQMKTQQPRRVSFEMDAMVYHTHAMLDIGMSRVVPVTTGVRLCDTIEQHLKIIINRQLIEFLTIFQAKCYSMGSSIDANFLKALIYLRPIRNHLLAQFLTGLPQNISINFIVWD